MNEFILGLHIGHNSSATLIQDNKIIAAIEEERLSRKKRDDSFPILSINFCLKEANINYHNIKIIAVGWNPYNHYIKKIKFLLYKSLSPLDIYKKILFIIKLYKKYFVIKNQIKKYFPNSKIIFIEHHIAHAASAFYTSPFQNASILTLDGRGEWSTGLLAYGDNTNIRKIQEGLFPQSLGILYSTFTHFLGFKQFDEYKVMGLASYGKPLYIKEMREVFLFNKKFLYIINKNYVQHPAYSFKTPWGKFYWTEKIKKIFGKHRKHYDKITTRHKNIASSLQVRLNEVSKDIVDTLLDNTKNKNLCLAGGVCLNGVMNYNLYKKCNIENIFIQPASGDGGISLGAALEVHSRKNKKRIYWSDNYLGGSYNNTEILKTLKKYSFKIRKTAQIEELVAQLLVEGKIIGWFQGKSEFGERALGSRSIIADPRPSENKQKINSKIKYREEFRPFAPSILEEESEQWFELNIPSPYMSMVCKIKEDKKHIIQAVTHIDGTARPQTVSKKTNLKFYNLINSFYKKTGCPLILNTSFNIKGEPIVETPTDAINTFLNSDLDFLAIGDYLVEKKYNVVKN